MFNLYIENIRKNDVKNFTDLSLYDLIEEYVPEYIDKKLLWENYKILSF